jgi:hypothetical protein
MNRDAITSSPFIVKICQSVIGFKHFAFGLAMPSRKNSHPSKFRPKLRQPVALYCRSIHIWKSAGSHPYDIFMPAGFSVFCVVIKVIVYMFNSAGL